MKLLRAVCAASAAAFAATSFAADAVPMRGVVEGYYGRPWGTEGRLSLLKFMGEMDMNVFIYGPKDDPYHHAKWREPYPESEVADFRRLLACAKENGVSLYWAIHLGDGFRQDSGEDYKALFAKLGLMYDCGFRGFAAFFDDFGGADASAHAAICNRILNDFLLKKGDCGPLIMCPNVYWGTGHPYQKALGAALDPRVHIMWTGRGICADIRAEDVAKITQDFRRPPFIWWNWPVNDYCRSSLLLGRAYGLDGCRVAGFVSNPMENCEAGKIALYGVAKWCADPSGFNSQKAWDESFSKIYPDPAVAKAMRVFAEHNSDPGPTVHGYRREESVCAAPLCAKARAELDADGELSAETVKAVEALFREVYEACEVLDRKLPKGRYDLGWEIEGWLEDEKFLMGQGVCAIRLLKAPTCAAAQEDVDRMRALRRAAAESARRHREKFQAATFDADRRYVKPPVASSRELRPLVEKISVAALTRLGQMKGGAEKGSADVPRAFSTARPLEGLVASRDGKYASLSRVMEARSVAAGETFGIAVPKTWATDYFHARLGDEAVKAGVIEVSKDGGSWTKLATDNRGGEMQSRLNPSDGWRYARYRNVSPGPVNVKIDLFKFDVTGGAEIVDDLLSAL